MFEKVQELLADALNISAEKITPDSKIIDDLGADSLDVVELLGRLEDEYGIIIPDEDVEGLATVQDVANEIEKLTK
ncbi:MAG: acyl carrier protein [Clostridia bacterium]|nr:acyl carrier protein [Clostridia bacterium]